MKVLLVHQNFPGQYLHLARYLGASGNHEVVFITQRKDGSLPGVKKIVYRPKRSPTAAVHHYLRESEAAVLNAQEVARIAIELRNSGFIPDVMLGHNGWGEIWYLRDIFPNSPLIGYFEFFYRMKGADVGFDVNPATRSDLLEIIDDRAANKATIITTQLPVDHWHAWIGDETVADAILDRVMQRVHRINLGGDSLRLSNRKTTQKEANLKRT
jgi:hypothetical protein